jgi:hypothetical protein
LFVLNYWGEVEERGPSGTEGIVGGPFFARFPTEFLRSTSSHPAGRNDRSTLFIAAEAFRTENSTGRIAGNVET